MTEQNLPQKNINSIPFSPEILVPKLGEYLVEKGFVTKDELSEALVFQKKKNETGSTILLGQALIEMGVLDRQSLDQAVTEQIIQLQSALQASNKRLEDRVRERTVELEKALDKLTDLNALKTNFVSNISHELRTPLAHMVGYLDLLKEQQLGPLNEEQAKAMDVLGKAYERLYGLIDNLIQFSLVSQSDESITLKKAEAAKIIEATVSHAQTLANANKINLAYNIPNEAIYTKVDQEKIVWVLQQLVDNAMKFNRENGKVEIRLESLESQIVFSVLDTGIGIEESQLKDIFEPFHQLDGSATRRYGGTGIGLALVKQILDSHNSKLHVISKPGVGSKFTFSLPAVIE